MAHPAGEHTQVKHEKTVAHAAASAAAPAGQQPPIQRPIRPRAPVASTAAGSAAQPQADQAPPSAAAPAPAKPAATSQVQFSYSEIDGATIPKIFRSVHGEQVAYVVVRMVELKLLWRFPNNYPDELKRRPPLRSSYMTDDEGALINEINELHCLNEYGKHDYSKRDNMLVKFDEFMDFYDAVRRCYADIAANHCVGISFDELNQMKGGFLQINNTVCPFVFRKEIKFVPYTFLHSCGMNIGLESTKGFGFFPSPKECAFFNSITSRLNLKVQMGMLSKMMSLDMIEKLTDCVVRDLNIMNPIGSTQFMPNQSDIRLAGQTMRHQPQPQQPAVFNVMTMNRPAMISVAPLVSGPGGTYTANGIPVLSSAQLLQAPMTQIRPQAPMQQQQISAPNPTIQGAAAAAAAAVAAATAATATNGITGVSRQRPPTYQQSQQQPTQQSHLQQQPQQTIHRSRLMPQLPVSGAPIQQAIQPQPQQQQAQPPSSIGPSDPKRRRIEAGTLQHQQQQPQQRQLIKEAPQGSCSLLKVQGDFTGGKTISLCLIRPYLGLLPENALQGDYVVLDHVRCTQFPLWSADRLLTVLSCVVPTNKIYRMAEGLVSLFEEAFSFRLGNSRDHALLHAETFLKNLPFLQIRYAEFCGAAGDQQHQLLQQQSGRIALRAGAPQQQQPQPPSQLAAASTPVHVLANIQLPQHLMQQQQQQQHLVQQPRQQPPPQLLRQQPPLDVIQIDD